MKEVESGRDELGEIVAALENELRFHEDGAASEGGEIRVRWLQRAHRLAGVTADRPYLYRPGATGRLRGLVLVPPKAVLRRLMRWYVEPLATDQREFNAALLHAVDELATATNAELKHLRRAVDELGERVAGLEARRPTERP
jgi:hypothetical protein